MKFLISGGTGYLGSALCRALARDDAKLTIISRNPMLPSSLESIGDSISLVSPAVLMKTKDERTEDERKALENIDVVIHCATLYGKGEETEQDVKQVNLDLAIQLLRFAESASIETFMNVDTPIPETVSLYAKYKGAFREILKNESLVPKRLNIPLQYFYSSEEPAGRLVSSLLGVALENRPYFDLSPGEQKRDFVALEDVVSAFERLVEALPQMADGYSQFALGSGEAHSLKELVGFIQELLPESTTEFRFGAFPYRENELMLCVADIEELSRLGWKPKIHLREGLATILEEKRRT